MALWAESGTPREQIFRFFSNCPFPASWVDVDDLNDREVNGVMQSVVHYNRPEGYVILGERFARQGYALIKGKEPAEDGRP